MGVLIVIVAADPALGGGRAAVKRSDANVLFVVDTTGSMAAEDYNGGEPRLAGVRHDIAALADEFPGAHFALVTFNSRTRVIVPWTTDRGALDSATQLLRQEWTLYAQGTRLDEPLPTMRRRAAPGRTESRLRRGVLPLRRRADRAAGAAVVRTASATSSPAAPCSATARRTAARMHVYIGHDEDPEQFIADYETGADAVSRIDEANLAGSPTSWASATSTARSPSDVGEIAGAAADRAGTTSGSATRLRRLYWLPAFGVIALVLWQLARTALEIVDDRRVLGGRTTEGPDVSEPDAPRAAAAAATSSSSSSVARAADRRRPRRRRCEAGDDELVVEPRRRRRTTTTGMPRVPPRSTGCRSLNVVDPWRAHLGSGAALYRRDDLERCRGSVPSGPRAGAGALRRPLQPRRHDRGPGRPSRRASGSSVDESVLPGRARPLPRRPRHRQRAVSARLRRPATQASASRKLAAALQDKLGPESSEPEDELSAPVQREVPNPVGERG